MGGKCSMHGQNKEILFVRVSLKGFNLRWSSVSLIAAFGRDGV
jgi:hypothetical protein